MDPISLAVVTSSLTMLANEAAKSLASEAGKSAWSTIMGWFKWTTEPPIHEIPRLTAERLVAEPALADRIVELLRSCPCGSASTLVGTINAPGGKVVTIGTNSGTITL
jgi:hypothetical protein